jgi:cbb3-type cytochrome oxidase subunit 3
MDTLRQLYRRLDDRARDLSRVSYALLVGLVSAAGVFAIRLLLPGDGSFGPVAMGFSMAVVYYAFDPNSQN